MRNIVYQSTLPISYPLPILMRVSYNTLIVKQNTSDYYKYSEKNIHIVNHHQYSFSQDKKDVLSNEIIAPSSLLKHVTH